MSQEEINASNNGGAVAVCPKKKRDKSPVVFYTDRMVFNGETIMYSDIDIVNMGGSHTTYYALFESFSGYVKFHLKDNRKLKWKVGSFGAFGLGNVKTKSKYYGLMLEASISTVAKVLAAAYLNQLKLGSTITVAGVTITPDSLTAKQGLRLKPTTVSLNDVAYASFDRGNIYVCDEAGKPVFNAVSVSLDNAACLLTIINTLASKNSAQKTTASQEAAAEASTSGNNQ